MAMDLASWFLAAALAVGLAAVSAGWAPKKHHHWVAKLSFAALVCFIIGLGALGDFLWSSHRAQKSSDHRPPSDYVETPRVELIPEPSPLMPKELVLFNRGQKDFYFCGDRVEGTGKDMDSCMIVPEGAYYYLFTNRLEQWAQQNVSADGDKLVAFDMYFMDERKQKKFTGRFRLFIVMKAGAMQVNTQMLGVVPDDWGR